jgi:hypothetical protein
LFLPNSPRGFVFRQSLQVFVFPAGPAVAVDFSGADFRLLVCPPPAGFILARRRSGRQLLLRFVSQAVIESRHRGASFAFTAEIPLYYLDDSLKVHVALLSANKPPGRSSESLQAGQVTRRPGRSGQI